MVAGSLSWQIAQIQVRKATVNKLKPKTVKSVKISCISRLSEKSQETGLKKTASVTQDVKLSIRIWTLSKENCNVSVKAKIPLICRHVAFNSVNKVYMLVCVANCRTVG